MLNLKNVNCLIAGAIRRPKEIIGLTDESHENPHCFLVAFPDEKLELVDRHQASLWWPNQVIDFYQKHLIFDTIASEP